MRAHLPVLRILQDARKCCGDRTLCEALVRELQGTPDLLPSTIYFGGGTPTALKTSQLEFILAAFHQQLDPSELKEWTIEANPGSVSARKAALLNKFGVNRISLGVQSWDNNLLNLLGREHNAAQAEESFRIFRDASFPTSASTSCLHCPDKRKGSGTTPCRKQSRSSPSTFPPIALPMRRTRNFSRDSSAANFQRTKRGSRFSRNGDDHTGTGGLRTLRNLKLRAAGISFRAQSSVWRGADYVGLGPSAFSTRGFERWQNVADHHEYARRLFANESPVASVERLTPEMKRTERIALGLRTLEGITADTISINRTHALSRAGLLRHDTSRVSLTRAGRLLADSIAEELL